MDIAGLIGKRVMVYYNLHKNMFSVLYKQKIILHINYICLVNVEFRGRKSGQQKVRQEKRKNVHAFVIGNITHFEENKSNKLKKEIIYNPYKHDTFVYKNTQQPIYLSNMAELVNKHIYLI